MGSRKRQKAGTADTGEYTVPTHVLMSMLFQNAHNPGKNTRSGKVRSLGMRKRGCHVIKSLANIVFGSQAAKDDMAFVDVFCGEGVRAQTRCMLLNGLVDVRPVLASHPGCIELEQLVQTWQACRFAEARDMENPEDRLITSALDVINVGEFIAGLLFLSDRVVTPILYDMARLLVVQLTYGFKRYLPTLLKDRQTEACRRLGTRKDTTELAKQAGERRGKRSLASTVQDARMESALLVRRGRAEIRDVRALSLSYDDSGGKKLMYIYAQEYIFSNIKSKFTSKKRT